MKSGEDLKSSDRVEIETTDYAALVNNKKCERGDSGRYKITLTNELGTDSAFVKLTVVGMAQFKFIKYSCKVKK